MELALFNERRTRFTTRERVGRVFEDISALERSGVSSKEINGSKRMRKEVIRHNEYNSTLEDNYVKIEVEDGVIYFELKDGIIEYGINIKELLSFIEDSKAKVPLNERGVK